MHKNYCFTKYWGGFDVHIYKKKVIWKVQILEETSIFTLLCNVSFWQNFSNPPTYQKCQNDVLCGNVNIKFYPYTFKLKSFFKKYLFYNDCLGSCLSIVIIKFTDVPSQKVSLITLHSNKPHLLNISCYHM